MAYRLDGIVFSAIETREQGHDGFDRVGRLAKGLEEESFLPEEGGILGRLDFIVTILRHIHVTIHPFQAPGCISLLGLVVHGHFADELRFQFIFLLAGQELDLRRKTDREQRLPGIRSYLYAATPLSIGRDKDGPVFRSCLKDTKEIALRHDLPVNGLAVPIPGMAVHQGLKQVSFDKAAYNDMLLFDVFPQEIHADMNHLPGLILYDDGDGPPLTHDGINHAVRGRILRQRKPGRSSKGGKPAGIESDRPAHGSERQRQEQEICQGFTHFANVRSACVSELSPSSMNAFLTPLAPYHSP